MPPIMPPMPNSPNALGDVKDVLTLLGAVVTITGGGLGVTAWFSNRFKSDDAMELLSKLSTSMNALTEDTSRLEKYLRILAAVHRGRGNLQDAQTRVESRTQTLQDIDRIGKASNELHEEVTRHLQRSFVSKYWNLVQACRKMREQCENIRTEHGKVLDLSSQSVREAMREGVNLEPSMPYPGSIPDSPGNMRPRMDWPVDVDQRGSASAAARASTSGGVSSSHIFNLSSSSDPDRLYAELGRIAARRAEYSTPLPGIARADDTRAFYGSSRDSMSMGIMRLQAPPHLHHESHGDGVSSHSEASEVTSNALLYQLPARVSASRSGNHQDLVPLYSQGSTPHEEPTTRNPAHAAYDARGHDKSRGRRSNDLSREEPPNAAHRPVASDSRGRQQDGPISLGSRPSDPVKTRGQPKGSAVQGIYKLSSSQLSGP